MSEPDERNELAEERTDLAKDRTLLANERTFAGWMRTGLAAVAVGLGFSALFREVELDWAIKAIATVFILTGIFVFWAAEQRARKLHRRHDGYEPAAFGARRLRVVAAALTLGSLALIAAMWMLV